MDSLPRITSINILDGFWNASTIAWAAIWAAIFHYVPVIVKNRQIVVKGFRMFYAFYFLIFSWIHSDFFFISALVFTKIRKKSMANMCGKQAMKTFGTFPLLMLAYDFGNYSKGNKESLSRNWYKRDFDFHSELKQIISG